MVELLLAIAVHRVDSVRLSKTKEVSKAATKIHGEGSAPIWRRPHIRLIGVADGRAAGCHPVPAPVCDALPSTGRPARSAERPARSAPAVANGQPPGNV